MRHAVLRRLIFRGVSVFIVVSRSIFPGFWYTDWMYAHFVFQSRSKVTLVFLVFVKLFNIYPAKDLLNELLLFIYSFSSYYSLSNSLTISDNSMICWSFYWILADCLNWISLLFLFGLKDTVSSLSKSPGEPGIFYFIVLFGEF